MNIYWEVLFITAVLAVVFRNNKKWFVVSTSMVHLFVCGFRYIHMHGDLIKYHVEFEQIRDYGWFSKELWHEGRNSLFYVLNKWIGQISNSDFQVLLFVIAFISTVAIAVVIYKYSPMPYMSFLLWSCFGYYMFTFYSIKQTLAMAIVMLSFVAINNGKRVWFYILVIIAGFVHLPAFVFFPAYEIAHIKNFKNIISIYLLELAFVFVNRGRIVEIMADVYYESDITFDVTLGGIGGKSFLIFALLLCGFILASTSHYVFKSAFIMILLASMIQLFAIYDNVFTRLSDYYMQFIIIYAPCMLAQLYEAPRYPRLFFNRRSQKVLQYGFVVLAVFYYYYTTFRGVQTSNPDNLVMNFAFMWQK